MLIGLSSKHDRPAKFARGPGRRKKKKNRQQRHSVAKRAAQSGSHWYGPVFDADPADAPAFLGPGRGPNAIYVLIDDRTGCVAYVGKTNHPDRRFWQHFKAPHNAKLRRWQRDLAAHNKSPRMVVVDSAGDDWPECEKAWIAYYRSHGAIMNVEDGGRSKRACLPTSRKRKPRITAEKPSKEDRAAMRSKLDELVKAASKEDRYLYR